MTYEAALQIADGLRASAEKAAALIEAMAEKASVAETATLGVLPDGTPVADMLEELRELRADFSRMKKEMQTIANLCDAPHWDTKRRWQVRDIAHKAVGGKGAGV